MFTNSLHLNRRMNTYLALNSIFQIFLQHQPDLDYCLCIILYLFILLQTKSGNTVMYYKDLSVVFNVN